MHTTIAAVRPATVARPTLQRLLAAAFVTLITVWLGAGGGGGEEQPPLPGAQLDHARAERFDGRAVVAGLARNGTANGLGMPRVLP